MASQFIKVEPVLHIYILKTVKLSAKIINYSWMKQVNVLYMKMRNM